MRLRYTALAAMAALFLMMAGAYAMPTQDQTAQPSTTTPAKQAKASKKKAANSASDMQAGAMETKTEKKVEKAEKAGKYHQLTGDVTNVSNDSLTISAGRGAKKEEKTFTVTDKTKKPADLANGERVTVHFTTEAGKDTATRIVAAKASRMKHAKAAKTGAGSTTPQ